MLVFLDLGAVFFLDTQVCCSPCEKFLNLHLECAIFCGFLKTKSKCTNKKTN